MYNRKHIRLKGFDYASRRFYFITINVKDHINSFGRITDKKMKLSVNGSIALKQWIWLGKQYPYIKLISFVVMPDHIHGIIYINSDFYLEINVMGIKNVGVNGRNPSLFNSDENHSFIQIPKIKPLFELIGAYKTTVSKRIHEKGDLNFRWQNSYHDHIIRNEWELPRIKKYIEDNPANWKCKEGSRPFPA
jgi:REP element-mobilizing transposase RayT